MEKGHFSMLIGEYQHTLDVKGRIFIPAKLREDLGKSFIVTKNMEKCLSIYSLSEWTIFENNIQKMPYKEARLLIKFYHGSAAELEPDKQGRVVIPQHLREYAGLEKEVSIVGALDHVELWDKEMHDKDVETIDSDQIVHIMEKFKN